MDWAESSLGNAKSEVDLDGILEPPDGIDRPRHPPAGESDAQLYRERGGSELRCVKVAEPESHGSDFAVLDAGESRSVEGDHRHPLGGFRAEHIAPPAHPKFVGSGGVVLPETPVGKGEEVGLKSVALHRVYYTNRASCLLAQAVCQAFYKPVFGCWPTTVLY